MARTMTIGTKFKAIDQMSKPMRTMGLQSDKMAGRMKRSFSGVASTLRTIRKVATIAFAAVGISASLMIGSVARDFVNFDEAIVSASSKFSDLDLTTQAGIATYDRMKKAAREVGATTKFTAAEAAAGLNYLAMAGFNAEQAIVALPETSNLAIVAQTDLARATDITTDSLGAFGLMADDTAQLQQNLGRVNDVYAKTVSRTNTTLDDLFEAVKKGAPTFTAAGQRMETFNALAGVMANSGVKGAEAGTALRNVMLRLSKPTGEASKYLRRLGVQTSDENGNFRDAIDILSDLEKGLVGMGTQQRSAALSTIFGARAVTSVNVLLAEGTDSLKGFRDELDSSAGTADKMAGIIGGSLSNRLKSLKSAATDVGFQFFESFDEQAGSAIDTLTEKLRNVDVQPIVDKLVSGTNTVIDLWNSGLIPTILQFIGYLIALKLAIGVFTLIKTAILGIGTALGIIMAHPILASIAALAVGAFFVIKNWEKVKTFFSGLWDDISYGASVVYAQIKYWFDIIADYLKEKVDKIKAFFQPLIDIFDKFKDWFTDTPEVPDIVTRNQQGGFAPPVTTNEGRVSQYSDWYANNPVSPNAGVVETRNTEKSQVEVTFTNPPEGTQIRQNGNAPGLVLNTGTRAW